MKVNIIPKIKYDKKHSTHKAASVVALVVSVLFAVWGQRQQSQFNDEPNYSIFAINIVFRIVSAAWVFNIMKDLNRDSGWSAFAAACFPGSVLFIAGLVWKKNIRLQLDTSYDANIQLSELRKVAQAYIKQSKHDEAAFVYRYIVENLPASQEDIEKYTGYRNNSLVVIPEYDIVNS